METPRDLPKPEDLFLEVHAARMLIRNYEARLDRIECMAAEVCRRRYQRHRARLTAPANSERAPGPGSTRGA